MKAAPNLDFTHVKFEKTSFHHFVQMIKNVYQNLVGVINGQIGFGDGTNLDNINGSWINVVAPVAPNTDFTVNHNLQRLPVGYWVMQKDRAVDVYTGSVAATSTQITLRATVASAVLRLFIVCFLLSVFSTRSEAQGVRHVDIAQGTVTLAGSSGFSGAVMRPIPSALITVCTGSTPPAFNQACTGLASIYSDISLTTLINNPFNADIQGNYSFYASGGVPYVISVGAIGFTTYSYVWSAPSSNAAGGTFTGNISFQGNNTHSGTETFTGAVSSTNFNNVQWAGPGATQTIDQAVTACGANPCTVMISSLYTGAESANLTFNAVDGSVYNIYRGSNNITIHDLRASTNKAYGVNYGGTTLGSQARFAVTQAIASPSSTTSAILATNQVSGNVSAGGGALAAITGEVDIEGAITGAPANIVQASNGQWAVRSTGQTLPLVVGVQGGGGIDRAAGVGGTNITTAEGVEGDGASPNLGTGTIQDNFAVRGVQTNVGTRNNFALVSEGNIMLKDNGCIFGENGSVAALQLICFGIDNNATGGGNIYSTTNSPAAWKYIVNGGHFNWEAGPQINLSNCFEVTPGTAVNGTTFSNPAMTACTSTGGAGNSVVNIPGSLTVAGVPVAGSGFTGVNVTPVTVSANVATDQNGMAITLTAGALNSVSRTLLIQLAGVYSTPAASTTTLTHKLKLCTVSGCGSGTVVTLASWTSSALGGIQATNNPYNVTLNSSTQTAGASAAFEAHGNLTIDVAALATAAEAVFADNNTATVGTIDSTAQLFLQHTIAFSAASGSNSATDRQMIADTVD